MNIQDMFPIQYVLSSKNYLNCFAIFGSSVCQGSTSWVLFGPAILLPRGQIWDPVEGTAWLSQC